MNALSQFAPGDVYQDAVGREIHVLWIGDTAPAGFFDGVADWEAAVTKVREYAESIGIDENTAISS